MSRLRGQGYDGASNMQGEFNGLEALILKENEYAFYVHCFAHQLQLAFVAIAKNNVAVDSFFTLVTSAVHVVGGSSKRHDVLQENRATKVMKPLESGELANGQGQNQEITLKRVGDTRWGSHYSTVICLIAMFSSIIDVLKLVANSSKSEERAEACFLLESLQSFYFYLMKNILRITNEFSQALQRKDQDIVNAMQMVKIAKLQLQSMRDEIWDSLLEEVSLFCDEYYIDVPNMDDMFVVKGRSRCNVEKMKNIHHYQVELFYGIIVMQLQELNNRFNEVNTEQLLYVSCLTPSDSIVAFDKERLIHLAKFYWADFSEVQLITLAIQLDICIIDMRSNNEFSEMERINSLAEKMVKTKKDVLYPLVYKLVTLALILPVSTATVERAFSAMQIVKNRLRNQVDDR